MVFSLIRLGYLNDERVQKAIQWITKYRRYDDGIDEKPWGWPYDQSDACRGKHSCPMGLVKALKALAEIPAGRRNGEVINTIEPAVEYLLSHHIYKRSHDS